MSCEGVQIYIHFKNDAIYMCNSCFLTYLLKALFHIVFRFVLLCHMIFRIVFVVTWFVKLFCYVTWFLELFCYVTWFFRIVLLCHMIVLWCHMIFRIVMLCHMIVLFDCFVMSHGWFVMSHDFNCSNMFFYILYIFCKWFLHLSCFLLLFLLIKFSCLNRQWKRFW